MSQVASSNYMSDGAILAWVTAQQNRLYGDLQGTMSQQELQSEMENELADIKLNLQGLVKDNSGMKTADAQLQSFIDKYGKNPDFAEIVATVEQIERAVSANIPKNDAQGNPIIGAGFQEQTVKDLSETLDKKLSAAGTNQQLGMVHINELKSTIDQSTQVASQLIKSSNDATESVIHNIS